MGKLLGFPIGDVVFMILFEVIYGIGKSRIKIHLNKPLFFNDII